MINPYQLPSMAEADKVDGEEQVVVQHWMLPRVNFHWWMVAFDPETRDFLGYANLNDDSNAEWGLIPEDELVENCASVDNTWIPKKFKDCVTDSLQLAALYPSQPVRYIRINRADAH